MFNSILVVLVSWVQFTVPFDIGKAPEALRGPMGKHNIGSVNLVEDGIDIIEFAQGPADINGITISQFGADTLIIYEDGVITIKDFDSTLLDASDFNFVNPSKAETPDDKKTEQTETGLEAHDLSAGTDDAVLMVMTSEPAPYIYQGIDGILDIITADEDGYCDLFG